MKNNYILWFDEVDKHDGALVGGKGANLGEMIKAGIPVPFGFVVTAQAYYDFLKESGLTPKIKKYIQNFNHKDTRLLKNAYHSVRKTILNTSMPEKIGKEIASAYLNLTARSKQKLSFKERLASLLKEPYVAVRSSATAEDLPTASFAGQQATYLNVRGETNVVRKVQEAWASLFTARAIFYREEQKYDHFKVGIAVPVQLMIDSKSSGVMFTLDPITNDKNKMIIEAVYGLGEMIVGGEVTPDHYIVSKKDLKTLEKKIARQEIMLVKHQGTSKKVKIGVGERDKQKITDKEITEVARLGKLLEKHYYFPQDVEWAIENGHVYIVQTRPITTIKKQNSKLKDQTDHISDNFNLPIILKGDPASPGVSSGPVKIILKVSEIDKVKPGDVLVTVQTNPDFVPAMKKAVAIVTERGGRTSHAAIVSRELGIPAVVGTITATKTLKEGQVVTINGGKGEIYKGGLSVTQTQELNKATQKSHIGATLKTATKVYVNLASPLRVEEVAKMNFDGVGLLRAEFMIADIGTHPKKLIKEHKEKVFITKLAADLAKFCHAFNPRPVVYRATDFKTNEYRNLIGGKEFEPEEPNPMLGYRGAYRYMSDPRVFELELETIKLVRNKFGYKNLWLMLPFVRTVKELSEVKKIIAANGLLRSPTFKLWMMVEIPSNAIILDQFLDVGIDGVSIGSNDLTMLILGTDRDNNEVAPEFDERNPAVLWAIERVIKTCHKYNVTSSICGQAPSDYPELVDDLVKWGITSMSVNPDAVNNVRETIHHAESKMVRERKK